LSGSSGKEKLGDHENENCFLLNLPNQLGLAGVSLLSVEPAARVAIMEFVGLRFLAGFGRGARLIV
jgi:hypothetical protein